VLVGAGAAPKSGPCLTSTGRAFSTLISWRLVDALIAALAAVRGKAGPWRSRWSGGGAGDGIGDRLPGLPGAASARANRGKIHPAPDKSACAVSSGPMPKCSHSTCSNCRYCGCRRHGRPGDDNTASTRDGHLRQWVMVSARCPTQSRAEDRLRHNAWRARASPGSFAQAVAFWPAPIVVKDCPGTLLRITRRPARTIALPCP